MSQMLAADDASSMSDDVFEDAETTQRRIDEMRLLKSNTNTNTNTNSIINTSLSNPQYQTYYHQPPPPPPPQQQQQHHLSRDRVSEAASIYHGDGALAAMEYCHEQNIISGGGRSVRDTLHMYDNSLLESDSYRNKDDSIYKDDDWHSYHYDEVGIRPTAFHHHHHHHQPFDDTVNHKTILLGDSGVGKTSFLVKYNTGEFRLGSFSATVGIALTVIILGDSGVGKTSMLIMFRDGICMPGYYITTVGIDFMNKVVVVDGTRVKLQIWDTAGQERFRSVTHAYYRDAHALLLLYDVTNKSTYDNIRAWLCEIRDCAQEDVAILLIGNKADCSNSERQVKREDGERLAREYNVPFMETSAKTGLNVELAFQTVARQLRSRGYKNGDNGRFNVHEFVRDNTKAKSMCAQCNL